MAIPPFTYPDWRYYYDWFGDMPLDSSPTDGEIKSIVVERLATHPNTEDEDIEVEVEGGIVTLTGEVSTWLAKRTAGDDAWDTAGVVDVNNRLETRRLDADPI
jgi:osmotically-inducible protein OsmY